jgi:hypothetical protein
MEGFFLAFVIPLVFVVFQSMFKRAEGEGTNAIVAVTVTFLPARPGSDAARKVPAILEGPRRKSGLSTTASQLFPYPAGPTAQLAM